MTRVGRKNSASSSSPLDSSPKPATWEPVDLACSRGEEERADENSPGAGVPLLLCLWSTAIPLQC